MAKVKKQQDAKSLLNAPCLNGLDCAKIIQINLGGIEVAKLPGSFVKIRGATRPGFYFSIHPLSGPARKKKTAYQKNLI